MGAYYGRTWRIGGPPAGDYGHGRQSDSDFRRASGGMPCRAGDRRRKISGSRLPRVPTGWFYHHGVSHPERTHATSKATTMASLAIDAYLRLLPSIQQTGQGSLWMSYDAEADVLYVNFKKPSVATDSELTDDDVIIRYEGEEVVGLTILHASQR